MRCGLASFLVLLRWQVINDRVRPGIFNQIAVFIFVHDADQTFFHIPAVSEMITFFFLLNFGITWRTMDAASSSLDSFFCHMRYPRGDSKVMVFVPVPYCDAEHQAYKAVPAQIVLIHPQIFCQILKPLYRRCLEKQAANLLYIRKCFVRYFAIKVVRWC